MKLMLALAVCLVVVASACFQDDTSLGSGDKLTADGGGAAGSAGGPVACTTSSEQLVAGKATGFAYCDDVLHRFKKVTCPNLLPRAQMPHPPGGDVGGCKSDADCTAKPNGFCRSYSNFIGSGWSCEYGCLNDQDCGSGFVCVCGVPVGICVATNCTTDADCAPGKLCAAGTGDISEPGGSCAQRLACQTAADQCTRRADCPWLGANPQYCAVSSTRRKCVIAPQDSSCF